MQSFLQRFAKTPLWDIFADNTPVSVFDSSLEWLNLPPADFIEYAEQIERQPYDSVPDEPSTFKNNPSFLLAQLHRIWLTLHKIDQHLPRDPACSVLDLGAYPFTLSIAIHRYLNRPCSITGTINQQLSEQETAALAAQRISLIPVNLDPRVRMENPLPGMTDHLPLEDASVDFILFAHVVEHLYQPLQILQEAFRVLKPGGKLLLTTDHAFMLSGLLNYLNNETYVYEPVETTAAMVFHEWRGHVRFYSEGDLRALISAAGGYVVDCELQEVLYNSVPEKYFVEPLVKLPRWRTHLLTQFPQFRNEILLVAERKSPTSTRLSSINPFDAEQNRSELDSLSAEFTSQRCDTSRCTRLDVAFGHRLFCGRWPTVEELHRFTTTPVARGLDGFVDMLTKSREFTLRLLAVHWERPGRECIIMTETPDHLRFWFSAQDTFVGFPIAVGVFEPDVQAALDRLLKPGMNCVDVGANLGFYSVKMASIVSSKGGKVFSFEPDPFNFWLLEKNRDENRLRDFIMTSQSACGEKPGEVRIVSDSNPANFGGMHIQRPEETAIATPTSAPVLRLDDVIDLSVRVDLVKIDVEGYEPLVIRGMKRIINDSHPVIICEFCPPALRLYGEDAPERLLTDLFAEGYTAYDAVSFGRGELNEFDIRKSTSDYLNLVFLPRRHSSSL